jgi:hypothetical protein
MSQKQNSDIAQKLLGKIRAGADPDSIAALFSDHDRTEDGMQRGCRLHSCLRSLTEPIKFDIRMFWRARIGQSSPVNSLRELKDCRVSHCDHLDRFQ